MLFYLHIIIIYNIPRTISDLTNMLTHYVLFQYRKDLRKILYKYFTSLQILPMNLLSSFLCNYFYIYVSIYVYFKYIINVYILYVEMCLFVFMVRPDLDPRPKLTPANSGIPCWPHILNLAQVDSISTIHPKLTPVNTIYVS